MKSTTYGAEKQEVQEVKEAKDVEEKAGRTTTPFRDVGITVRVIQHDR